MLRRRQINAGPGGRKLRSSLARASTPARDVLGAIEEHVVWRIADLVRGMVDALRWPLERLVWTVERRLVWPLRERAPTWEAPPRAGGGAALAAAAIGAVAIGVVVLGGGENGAKPLPTANPVVTAAPVPAPVEAEPSGPVLHGVAPKFGVDDGVGVARANDKADDAAVDGVAADDSPPATADAGATGEGESGATTSSRKAVPAGPEAMKVARRFSEAFVFYEIGERPARAMTVFEETATAQLATALAERPPRQPANAEVPKARVLNLVPGPRRGKAYTVSASLLRVGVTSELRLKLTKQAGAWRVTDVRG
jgi:hypothetical protein